MMASGEFQLLPIDDSAADSKLFETALREAGTRVKLYWVATAEEGFEYLRGEGRFEGFGPVSLIVCDLSLPGMDGFQFLSQAKKDPAFFGHSDRNVQ
jgi:CheY-like chemotaxis protein